MKICIIGKGPGWEHAPMEGETWGANDLVLRRPVKLVFEMHDITRWLDPRLPLPLHLHGLLRKTIEKINELGIPVITREKHELLPTAIPFPRDKVPPENRYFTSTIAYMIAYAVYKDATEIEIFGVSLLRVDEYMKQRPCIEAWIFYARARGIIVTVHGPTNLFSTEPYFGLYGYDWDNVDGQKT